MVTKEIEIEKKKNFLSKDCFIFHSNRKEYCIPKKKKKDNSTDFQKFLRL